MKALKRRHARAMERAKTLLENPPDSYKVYFVRDLIFDMIAIKQDETLILKVVLDEVSPNDIRSVQEQSLPASMTKIILKKEFRKGGFEEIRMK